MDRSSSLSSAAASAIPVPDPPHLLLTRGPPAANGRVPAGNGAAGSAEAARYLTEDHDRIARGLNDLVVYRLFAAGLDLEAALGLIGDHRGAGKIHHAISELDQAIRDLRDTIYGCASAAAAPTQVPWISS
jgi:signal transduction histidine kinase